MDRESVSEVVRQCLDEAFANLRGKRAGAEEWTREIKTQLCLVGATQQPPLHVCASGVHTAYGFQYWHLCGNGMVCPM